MEELEELKKRLEEERPMVWDGFPDIGVLLRNGRRFFLRLQHWLLASVKYRVGTDDHQEKNHNRPNNDILLHIFHFLIFV